MARHLMITDHYYPEPQLKQFAAMVIRGEALPINMEEVREMAAALPDLMAEEPRPRIAPYVAAGALIYIVFLALYFLISH